MFATPSGSGRRLWILAFVGAVVAGALAAPAHATPVLGTATIDYYLEAPQGHQPGQPSFDGFGRLMSAGAGYPFIPHDSSYPGFSVVSSVTSTNTFGGFVSPAPPALGSPATAGIAALNSGPTAQTGILITPLNIQANPAAPSVATTVSILSRTVVQNTSGANNTGAGIVAMATLVAIAPGGNVQASLQVNGHIDNPGPLGEFFSLPPFVVASDGTAGTLPDIVTGGTQVLAIPAGFANGLELITLFVVGYLPGLTVQDGGTLELDVAFVAMTDPSSFSLIEFPQSLLNEMLPDGPVLFSVIAADVPEPSTKLFGVALLILVALARATRRAAEPVVMAAGNGGRQRAWQHDRPISWASV